jgi:hypothetical protein
LLREGRDIEHGDFEEENQREKTHNNVSTSIVRFCSPIRR